MLRKNYLIFIVTLSIMIGLVITPSLQAQNWQSIPPYNLLWPLWSPTQSPINPVTGVATPILSEITSSTIFPMQPIMAWNPNSFEWPMSITMPWFFYNSPTGPIFFDAFYGLNAWPPPSFLDSAGAPVPITLAAGYSFSPLPLLKETQYIFELSNLTYLAAYGSLLGIDPTSLLSFADIWGLPIAFAGGIP
ncbi:MAG: hypothetical protein ACMUIP_01155 [bacterium]